MNDTAKVFGGRVTILGSGTSHGVPMIGCRCAVCLSDDPRDKRWRPSIFIEFHDGFRVLVDTTPDLRAQALRFNVTRVDAVLFTHSHADHILGLDDIRPQQELSLSIRFSDGSVKDIKVKSRIDTAIEVDYYKHGGILPYVLRELISKAGPAKVKAA